MAIQLDSLNLSDTLAGATDAVLQRVQRALVVVQNGHGVGAGVIWGDGLMVTNRHVVAGSRHIQITLADDTKLRAAVLAADAELDLALLQAELPDRAAAAIADSRTVKVGQFVMAVGHPWGQRGLVTAGLISGLGKARTQGPRGEVDILRTDAELAPGNSGGPLVNAAGGVIGINTMIVGGDLGIAVPSHVVAEFVRRAHEQARPQPSAGRREAWL